MQVSRNELSFIKPLIVYNQMISMEKIKVAPPVTEQDKEWLRDLWLREWGGETMISKGKKYHFQDLESVIAWADISNYPYNAGTEN